MLCTGIVYLAVAYSNRKEKIKIHRFSIMHDDICEVTYM
jgi:hypothetical protein